MDKDRQDYEGACHCGAVRFNVRLSQGLHGARRCTCSLCRMRGAVVVTAKATDLTVTEGKDALSLYRFNTGTAKHYFCSHCGIYTHHQRRSDPSQIGVNVACLKGVSPFDFEAVEVFDGVNHPSDAAKNELAKSGSDIVGTLRFDRSPATPA